MQAQINSGDTAWILVATALVLLMTPGLALFYGGMVRSKNVLSTFMHSFMAMGVVTVQWVAIGYSLSFGSDMAGLIGGLDFAFMKGVGMEGAPLAPTIPHILFMAFQMMFAIITPALISGAYAERLKFSAYLLFTVLWSTFIYDPLAHWVWGGGWLQKMGALDFAGGTVVHLSSGASAIVLARVLGPRLGWPQRKMLPHDLTMTLLGAGLLWFGWFGFNAGSALGANGLASVAFVNTHIAAAAAAVAWCLVEGFRFGKASALGFASGLVAGLVAITPAAGFVGPVASIAIGGLAGVVCYGGVLLKTKFTYDDTLDAFGVHGVGGALGALLTGVFAWKAWNPAGNDGLLHGNAGLLGTQALATLAAVAFSAIGTAVIVKLVDATVGLRVAADDEREGLDLNLHGEEGYTGSFGGAHAAPDEEPTSSHGTKPVGVSNPVTT
jgi:Amt family ammonium transporter